jgi:hypothetical protein
MMRSVAVDSDGFMRGTPYHDGFLDAVLLDQATVYLALRATSGERNFVILRKVRGLDVQGLREGNIVGNVRILSAAQAARDGEVVRILAERLRVDAGRLAPDVLVFWLESSYGADVIALCEAADVAAVDEVDVAALLR